MFSCHCRYCACCSVSQCLLLSALFVSTVRVVAVFGSVAAVFGSVAAVFTVVDAFGVGGGGGVEEVLSKRGRSCLRRGLGTPSQDVQSVAGLRV